MSQMLTDYTDTVLALQDFRIKHHELIDSYEFLQERVNDAEEALKAHARQHGREENELFIVTVTAAAVTIKPR